MTSKKNYLFFFSSPINGQRHVRFDRSEMNRKCHPEFEQPIGATKKATFYHILSVSRSLIGREQWEMRVHTTACVMNACREWLWSIYCKLAPPKKTVFCSKIVNFNENSTKIGVSVKPRTPRNTPGTPQNTTEQSWTTPEHPWDIP